MPRLASPVHRQSFMEVTQRLVEFWLDQSRRCVLCTGDRSLELRLYQKHKLVGLEPCQTVDEALDIVKRWREAPPIWPPY